MFVLAALESKASPRPAGRGQTYPEFARATFDLTGFCLPRRKKVRLFSKMRADA